MVGLGIGEMLGALLFGYIQDHFSNRVTALACFTATSLAVLMCGFYVYEYQFTFG